MEVPGRLMWANLACDMPRDQWEALEGPWTEQELAEEEGVRGYVVKVLKFGAFNLTAYPRPSVDAGDRMVWPRSLRRAGYSYDEPRLCATCGWPDGHHRCVRVQKAGKMWTDGTPKAGTIESMGWSGSSSEVESA